MTYSKLSPVLPEVDFRAWESLENLDHDQHEEVESDHECEEIPDPVNKEVSSDDEPSDQEAGVSFREEARTTQPSSRKSRQKQKYRNKRAAARIVAQQDDGTTLKSVASKKRSASGSLGIPSTSSYQKDFKPSKPSWKGTLDVEKNEREYSLHELVNDFAMKVIDWDGR